MFFKSQTILNDDGVILPDIQAAQVDTKLDRVILTPQEVQSVIEILPLGKASGPNGLNNRILREFLLKYLLHIVLSSTSHCDLDFFQIHIRKLMYALCPKKEIYP